MQHTAKRTSATHATWALSWLFLISSVVMVAAAAYLYLREPELVSGLVVREPERILAGIVAGKTYEIEFQIDNPTGEDKRVFGGPFLV